MIQGTLKSREERRLLRGHVWAYRNEFATLPKANDGDVVEVMSDQGRLVGRGFFQSTGGIAVRLLTRSRKDIDGAFFKGRVERALSLRQRLYPGQTVYRWLYGESDGLPGLIVDRYDSVAVAQSSCAFYDQFGAVLAEALMAQEGVTGVRLIINDALKTFGEAPDAVTCVMDGATFLVDFATGQKTGLFLDQRENQRVLERFAPGARVFDGHCYTGAWGIRAALAGAKEVICVDTSEPALAQAHENAKANGVLEQCRFHCEDVLDGLQPAAKDPFDVVIVDPPALAKARSHVKKAMGLYQAINRAAFAATKPGGILITSSCSHFVDESEFIELLKRASAGVQRHATLLELRGASCDHPIMLSMPETAYLKCAVLQVR